MSKLECDPENSEKFKEWIRDRGGIAQWKSINLSNPGASWSTPALTDGKPTQKPNWQCENTPSEIITKEEDVVVVVPKEVKRFHVGIRSGYNGLSFKVTDGGSRKIRSAVEKAGEGAWHEFDYYTQEAVIYKPGQTIPLSEQKISI